MCQVEVIGLMDRDRLARDDAGPDAAGSGKLLGPVGPKEQPGLAQLLLEFRIAEVIDRDPFGIGQQQNVFLPRDLAEQRLQPAAGDGDQPFGLFAMFAQAVLGHDMGGAGPGRVQPVFLDAAPP